MANEWLRLWHDMPTDPKWRTIARVSGQRIGDVMAIYCHILVTASRNVTRGHAHIVTEDLASALDMEIDHVQAILDAMQGRVLDGEKVTGWESRQPKKEDRGDEKTGAKSAAERKRAQRERERDSAAYVQQSHDVTASHDVSRNVTTDKDKDKDKDTEKNKNHSAQSADCRMEHVAETSVKIERKPRKPADDFQLPDWIPADAWEAYAQMRKAKRAAMTPRARDLVIAELAKLQQQGHAPGEVLAQSTRSNWTDVYPLKTRSQAADGFNRHVLPDISVHTADRIRYSAQQPVMTDEELAEAMRDIPY